MLRRQKGKEKRSVSVDRPVLNNSEVLEMFCLLEARDDAERLQPSRIKTSGLAFDAFCLQVSILPSLSSLSDNYERTCR